MVKGEGATQLTVEAAAQLRGLIIDRVLLPGEKIRQVEVAEQIGVSRSPLREALRTLEGEGVVTYEENRGYVVARLDESELGQILRMRELLEIELFATVGEAAPERVERLSALNNELARAIEGQQAGEILRINREFHFAIFELSPLNMFRREMQRLWQLSDFYSAAWWNRRAGLGERILTEHEEMIEALRTNDRERLQHLGAAHRTTQADATGY